ncbi:Hypothetical_protein [Hexamita inflata]|uniref:Hypothetical_protein n=1 Tax=Hexamita inflata TaxID=28002 RepID=A0AA86NLI9_9EUKA|nr:Hypothetical protein HINF_LOCUS9052 [Hexamita inflata]
MMCVTQYEYSRFEVQLKIFSNIYKIFIFRCIRNARQTGSLRKCAEHTDVPQGLAVFQPLPLGRYRRERELETAANVRPRVLRTAKAECSFPARTHTICTARRVRPSAFERRNVDLRHRLSECAERENWPGAMAVLERQMRWCSLSDEDLRQITWLSTQPAKLIISELRRKRLKWCGETCATCFARYLQFSSGM